MKKLKLLTNKQKCGMSLALLLLTAGSIVLVEYLHRDFQQRLQQQYQSSLSQQLSLVRANIESELNANIFLADSLATIITVNPQSSAADWEKLSETLMLKATSIRNLAVAPDNVVQFVYPLRGNEAVIGLDYRNNPEQLRTVELARQRQEIYIAGPLPLVQGGNAVIARMPVFIDPPANQQYWGTCSVVIDIDKLFTLSGLTVLEQQVRLALRGKDATGASGEVFRGDPEVFEQAFASETIRLLTGSWQLAIALPEHSELKGSTLIAITVRLVGYSLCLLLMLVLLSLFYAYRIARRNSLQDALTALPNRRFAIQMLERLVKSQSDFSILSLDLDKFKEVNDQYGHAVGDALLQAVAHRLQGALRGSDSACRLSGDEFLIILPRVSTEHDLQAIISKVAAKLSDSPFTHQGTAFTIQYSLGHARFPHDAQDLETLLHHADLGMYQQKAAHKAKSE
ncbi:diguanylate cyclase [Alishewanella agri BL06]|uniref:Diguanylate cyclase n=1 Tax=Alishewanella agri BL06 TaxID=1195246 RepID=I8U624_9ALTE|nr:diguanylate cyclase [Alishewanella agri]EIW87473.1 diguanylate cyclase [Alishewanella agri BL06]